MLLRLVSFLRLSPLRAWTILASLALCICLFGVWYLWLRKPRPTCSGDFDLVVVAAEIVDGLGGPPFKADIGIRNERIVCIGMADSSKARQVIDGGGLTVAPGFIDVHTHVEANVSTGSGPFLAQNFLRQGVTTIITGNCGRSFLDIRQLFRLLKTNGAQVNVASLVGHNAIRTHVMKQSAAAPTREELDEMKALTRAAMHEGALGLSTGLEYIPGAFAKTDEIIELAKTAAENNGLYVSHIRDEGARGEAAISEAILIGESAGAHVHISHFKAEGPNQWGSAQQRLDLVQEARESGLNISLDQYPYTASSTGISILLPARLSEGGLKAARLKLSDPVTRKQIRSEMLHQLEENGWKDYSFAKIAYCEFDHSLVGLTIPEISQCPREALPKGNRSMDTLSRFDFKNAPKQTNTESELERQADIVIDLFSHGGAQMVYFEMAEADVETIMKTPEIMFGSDSGVRQENALVLPHPRGLGTFPRILGLYAREKKLFSIEEGVRRMTSLPAGTFGLTDRGQIREGAYADLVVFDRNRILDTATYDQPLNNPEGIDYVIVNGSVVLDKGRFTRALPGMAIRHNEVDSR